MKKIALPLSLKKFGDDVLISEKKYTIHPSKVVKTNTMGKFYTSRWRQTPTNHQRRKPLPTASDFKSAKLNQDSQDVLINIT